MKGTATERKIDNFKKCNDYADMGENLPTPVVRESLNLQDIMGPSTDDEDYGMHIQDRRILRFPRVTIPVLQCSI
jgi:hypothetical protein